MANTKRVRRLLFLFVASSKKANKSQWSMMDPKTPPCTHHASAHPLHCQREAMHSTCQSGISEWKHMTLMYIVWSPSHLKPPVQCRHHIWLRFAFYYFLRPGDPNKTQVVESNWAIAEHDKLYTCSTASHIFIGQWKSPWKIVGNVFSKTQIRNCHKLCNILPQLGDSYQSLMLMSLLHTGVATVTTTRNSQIAQKCFTPNLLSIQSSVL